MTHIFKILSRVSNFLQCKNLLLFFFFFLEKHKHKHTQDMEQERRRDVFFVCRDLIGSQNQSEPKNGRSVTLDD